MADDTKSKLQEFRDRVTGSAQRIAGHPTVQGLANATPGLIGTGALAQALVPKQGRSPVEFRRDEPAAPMVLGQEQNPAPFPFNSGPQAYTPVEAAPALPAPGTKQAGAGGGGAGSPFGSLKEAVNQSHLARMEGMDQDAELQRDAGDAKVRKMTALSVMQAEQAGNMEIDARMQQQADFDAHQKQQAFLARNEQLANEIGDMKVDPDRLMKNQNTAQAASFALGSVLGGALRGLNGGSNDTLDRMDKAIDRDISAQQDAINNKKASLAARSSLFGQMLQETGDSRVAAMQTRNLMYESFKQKLLAEGERLGTDEARINAEQGARAVQEKQDVLREQLAAQNLQVAQQQAAAAAAAKAAAEKDAWSRSMEVARLALEKEKVDVDRAKVKGEGQADVNREVEAASKDLADKELAGGRAAVSGLRGALDKAGPNEGIAGIGAGAEAKRIAARALTFGLGSDSVVDRIALSDEERVNRSNWRATALAYQKQITGSGGSPEQMREIKEAFEGAKTPAEQRAAVARAENMYQQVEQRRIAGLSDAGRAEYARRSAREAEFANKVKGGK